MKRILQVFRDGRRFKPKMEYDLLDGYQGNVQALNIMSQMVREDRNQTDLRRFVEQTILKKVPGHEFDTEIEKIFKFCQKDIRYRKDPVKVERIADLWSCLYGLNPDYPVGDCGIKSTALATMLALFGHTPAFAIIKQNPYSTNFNHVFVEVLVDDEWRPLDPTPEDKPIYYEPKSLLKERFLIF